MTAMTIEEGETYDKAKQRTVAARVEDFLDGHKTIIYYPFAGGIDMKLKTWVYPANWHWVASYYGKKDKEQKAEIIQAFKEGEKKIIVATKAFGMGVDISDIDRVYHVAPSGTFVDYIQELSLIHIWVYVVLKLTDRIERFLGKGGIYVIRKFFGIILLAISARLFTANLTLLIEQFQKAQ